MNNIKIYENFMNEKDKSIINYSNDPGRIFLEQYYLPKLEGKVLFTGVNYYNDFYYLLIKNPKDFETLEFLDERKIFGSPYKHYCANLLDFNINKEIYDHVCCFGMLGHADDWEIIKTEDGINKCIEILDNLVKPGGTLLLGPCCSQVKEFNMVFWDKVYDNLCNNKYKLIEKKRVGINYNIWIRKNI